MENNKTALSLKVAPGQSTQQGSQRVQWDTPVAPPNLPNKFSPAATSAPIPIPGCKQEQDDGSLKLPSPYQPPQFHVRGGMSRIPQHQESRVHHRLDNITDYHRLGMRGWEHAQQERCSRAAQQSGRILAGQWPPKTTWSVAPVVRKDPIFETTEARVDEFMEGWNKTSRLTHFHTW
jgi:hypothetical protein